MTSLEKFLENTNFCLYKRLELNGEGLTDGDMVSLAAELKHNKVVESLDLGHNKIGEAGASVLGCALLENDTLTVLDLEGNNIEDAGASVIAEALKGNKTLTGLSLIDNNIGDDGARAIAEVLKALTTLDLEGNNIGDAGASAIAAALGANDTLTFLDLQGNNIGGASVVVLVAALKRNKTLKYLYISNNHISDEMVSYLEQLDKDDFVCQINFLHQEPEVSEEDEQEEIDPASQYDIEASKKFACEAIELADSYYAEGEYKKALLCYATVSEAHRIELCAKKWLEQDPQNPYVTTTRDHYLSLIGQSSDVHPEMVTDEFLAILGAEANGEGHAET